MTAPDAAPDPARLPGRGSRHPDGETSTVWVPDSHRYLNDPAYADAVQRFVAHHVPNGSVTDAAVLEDESGTRMFGTTSWFVDGQMQQDRSGRPVRVWIVAPLDAEVHLP